MPRDERSPRIDPHDAPGEPGDTKHPEDTGELSPPRGRSLNVFVLGLEPYTLERLHVLDPERTFTFHTLVPRESLRGVDELPVRELLEQADDQLARFEEPVDAILSFLDFPAVEMAAVLSGRYGTKGPTLEQIMRCNHKYWNRLLQREVSPESVPRFTTVNPFSEDPLSQLEAELSYPFWVKPLNAFRSHLGFRIDEPRDFHLALPAIRDGIRRLAEPLEDLMELAEMPEEIRTMGGHQLVGEEAMEGEEYTLEVNPRLSQSHMELFELVDGAGHLKAAVELALGRTPTLPYRNGSYACAAKFFIRSWGDAVVTRVPSPDDIRAIEEEVPGTSIEMQVEAGVTLSELYEQDSYSYELAWVWVGGQSRRELVEKHRRVEKLLELGLEPTEDEATG